jgi:choline-glycine betaine transporter
MKSQLFVRILGPNGVLGRVVNILSIIGGIMAVITIMIAGTRIIVSAGDSATIASSRQAILYAVFGLIIILLSQIMVRFVISKL